MGFSDILITLYYLICRVRDDIQMSGYAFTSLSTGVSHTRSISHCPVSSVPDGMFVEWVDPCSMLLMDMEHTHTHTLPPTFLPYIHIHRHPPHTHPPPPSPHACTYTDTPPHTHTHKPTLSLCIHINRDIPTHRNTHTPIGTVQQSQRVNILFSVRSFLSFPFLPAHIP